MDPWYVLFREGADAKWASVPSRGDAIAAARSLLDAGVPVIEVGPLDPGSPGDTVIGDALQELCSTFTP